VPNQIARKLRTNPTDAEKKLWRSLRQLKSRGFHFRRQVPIDGMVVDFACYSARLVIELDGGQHNESNGRANDERRDANLRRSNFKVLRFWNNDVLANIDGVMETVCLSLETPTPDPSPQGGGE
jgi:very-short-patch-repair endonuclease